MTDSWTKRWNDRFRQKEFAYGTGPNEFFKEQIQKLKVGKILFGAEGEGRNAVYAAKLGWEVYAFDISIEGRKKALGLAKAHKVSIEYAIGPLPDLAYTDEQLDAIALIYAHFPPHIRSEYHTVLGKKLKKGGTIIFEAFGKKHLEYRNRNPEVGGPQSSDVLFSTEELRSDFENYEILQLEEKEVELHEGLYHNGISSVIRFVGKKQ